MGLLDEKYKYERYDPPGGPDYAIALQAMYDDASSTWRDTEFDARWFGIVTPTKDQGACGSCAAFAATAQHESAILDKTGAKYKHDMDLSEQQLVECAYDNDNALACKGAFIFAYPKYIVENATGRVYHENHYPYLQGHTREPNPKPDCKEGSLNYWGTGAYLTEYFYDWECNEEKLKKMIVTYGSAVTVIYASDKAFKNLAAHDVLDYCSNEPVNHAVQAIGWGETEYGQKYWLIKNSWGEDFADGGIGKVAIGACGTAERCAAAGVGKYGKYGTPSNVPNKTGYLAAEPCDVSAVYPDLTGEKWVTFYIGGEAKSSRVKCAHGKCLADEPHNETNTCYHLCGRYRCTQRNN